MTLTHRINRPHHFTARASVMRLTAALVCALAVVLSGAEAVQTGAFNSATHRRLGRVDRDELVPVSIALKPRDFRVLEEKLYSVSDPRNIEYGNHLTKQQADALGGPEPSALRALQDWVDPYVALDPSSSARFSKATNTLKVLVRARQLEEMMSTKLHIYESKGHSSGQRLLMRASTTLTIPEHIAGCVAYVSLNTQPLQLRSLAASAPLTPSAPQAIGGGTLETIRRLYGIPDDLVVTNETNSQVVPSFYTESWSPNDLEAFHKQYLPGEPMPRIIEKGGRKNTPDHGTIEASLDVEYITGVARNATTYVWTMNGSNPFSVQDEPFVEFVEAVLELDSPPLVVSISYSDDEEHIFNTCADYARSFDVLLIKMGVRGITVLIASGDDGVAGLRPEFNNIHPDEACDKHGPQWPTASPYITAVGATMILDSNLVDQPFFRTDEEVVCSGNTRGMITSGGGFSSIYEMPEYQRRAVQKYLKTKRIPTRKGFFNASGRAYPDLSALGAGYLVQLNKRLTQVSGTSASTPVVGAMVTLWNDIRLNAGKPPLGFINPLIYHLAEHEPLAFNDVVVGNNGAKKGNAEPCPDSFGAAGGWDAATGVGTPNFAVIADFVRGLGSTFNPSDLTSTTTECSSNKSAPLPARTQLSAENKGSPTAVGIVLLVSSAFIAAVLSAVVAVRVYIRRSRVPYSSLNVEASNCGHEEASSVTPPGSPTQSPRGSIVRQGDEDNDADNLESGAEMSEISLR